jgi:hypothetical protein
MNFPPLRTQIRQIRDQRGFDAAYLLRCEFEVLARLNRSFRTVQTENSLAPAADHVHMGRSMIVG